MKKKLPKFGETRIVSRFLLFPLSLGRERRWLERVKIKQMYRNYRYNIWFTEGWEDYEFID
jgi:hypothetical protein